MNTKILVAVQLIIISFVRASSLAQGSLPWDTLGGSMNSYVKEFVVFDDGEGPAVYACGAFTMIGTKNIAFVAKWTGNAWVPLGSGVGGEIKAMEVFDDGSGAALYVTGRFATAGGISANNIAKWNGNIWSSLDSGLDDQGRTLTVFNDGSGPRLYVGGDFSIAGGESRPGVAAWSGSAWSNTMNACNGPVDCLTVYKEDGAPERLIAAGQFTQINGMLMPYAAGWDGMNWQSFANGLPGPVLELGIHNRVDASPIMFCYTPAGFDDQHLLRWTGNKWESSTFPSFMDNIWFYGYSPTIRGFASLRIDSRDIMFAAGDIAYDVFGCSFQNSYGVSAIKMSPSDVPFVAFSEHFTSAIDALWIGGKQTLLCSVHDGTHYQVKRLRTDRAPWSRFTGDGVLSVAGTACDDGDVDFCEGTSNFAQVIAFPDSMSVSSGGQTSSGKVMGSAMAAVDLYTTNLGTGIDIVASTSFQQPDSSADGDWGAAVFTISTGEACDFGQFGQFVNHPLHIWIPTTSEYEVFSDSSFIQVELASLTGSITGNQLSRGLYALQYTTVSSLGSETHSETQEEIYINIYSDFPGCAADLTDDGQLDFLDISRYVSLFVEEDLIIDHNNDGVLTFFDVSAYISLFLQGCTR